MNKYLLKKRIFAVVFLGAVGAFSAANFIHSYEALKECVTGEEFSVDALDTTITESLYGRMNYIETYAYIQKLMDKRECNNFSYVKDEEGFLHYASFFREEDTRLFEYALRVKRLEEYVESKGARVLFVVPPGKYDKEDTKLRTGIPVNDPNPDVDEIMFYLNRLGVETLDLRESMPNETMPYEETFFRTDHHWTVPAAFYATGKLVEKMEECFGENLDPAGYYTDIGQYDVVTYRSGMLGSMGRRTGANFSGMEDFTALWPRFTGCFHREYMLENGKIVKQKGSFTEVLMDTEVLMNKTDVYSDSQYSLYLNALRPYEKITNDENPDGCKIFMIRDSYFSPVIAFMMPMCGEIDAIWSLEETGKLDIETYVRENTFDYIIIEVYPYSLNDKAFDYFKEDMGE